MILFADHFCFAYQQAGSANLPIKNRKSFLIQSGLFNASLWLFTMFAIKHLAQIVLLQNPQSTTNCQPIIENCQLKTASKKLAQLG